MAGKTLSVSLKDHRESRGMRQQDVAQHLHVSRPVISNWERGDSEPSASQLLRLAKLYNISIDALVGNPVERQNAVVIDTCSLLKRPSYFEELVKRFDKVVVPDLVVSEINHQKDKGKSQVKQRAWLVLKNLDLHKEAIVIATSRDIEGESNDEKIMAVAARWARQEPGQDVHVISDDIYFKHLARQYQQTENLNNLTCLNSTEYLARFDQSLTNFDPVRSQAFYSCVKNGSVDEVKAFDLAGVDLNFNCPSDGFTPLIAAVRHRKSVELVTYLASLPDLDLDRGDLHKYNLSAVHHATQLKHLSLLKCLVENGADPDRGSAGRNQGNTALMIAAWSSFNQIIKYLLSVGACANQQDSNGFTPLIKACIKRHHEAVKILRPHTDLKIRCRDGKTAIEHLDDHPNNFKTLKLLKQEDRS